MAVLKRKATFLILRTKSSRLIFFWAFLFLTLCSSEALGSLLDRSSIIRKVQSSIMKILLINFPNQDLLFIAATAQKLVSNPFGIELILNLEIAY